jgi:hypothetical protein
MKGIVENKESARKRKPEMREKIKLIGRQGKIKYK